MKKSVISKLFLIALSMMVIFASACSQSSQNSGNESNSGGGQSANAGSSQNNAGGNDAAPKKAEFELKFSDVQPENHPTNIAAQWMADELEKRTDGRVTMRVYPGGQLGGPDELIAALELGDVDMIWVTTADLARHSKPFSIFSLSYLVQDREHFKRLSEPNSAFMAKMNELVDELEIGSRIVGMMGGSPRRLYNGVREVRTPDDLKGLKIRIQDSPVEAKIWSELGATPVPVAWTEVYTAMSSGVADGAESSTSAYYSNKFHEVAPYHSLTEHQFLFMPVLMSNKTYDKLPEDLRTVVLELAAEASEMSWQLYWEEEDMLIETLKSEGATITEVDMDAFVQKVAGLVEELAAEYEATELLELIRQAAP